MKQILLGCMLVMLVACAGDPPKWWNPSGRYNDLPENEMQTQNLQNLSKPTPAPKKEEVIGDEIIAAEDTSLETVEFQPLEENPVPDDTGDTDETQDAAPSVAQTPAQAGMLAPSILSEQPAEENADAEENTQEENEEETKEEAEKE